MYSLTRKNKPFKEYGQNAARKVKKMMTEEKLLDLDQIVADNHRCVRCKKTTSSKTRNESLCLECRPELDGDRAAIQEVTEKIIDYKLTLGNPDNSELDSISTQFVMNLHKVGRFEEALGAYDRLMEDEAKSEEEEKKDEE